MTNERSENLPGDARERAKRLVDDLSADAAELMSASTRIVGDDDRREGQALIAEAMAAAQRLHDSLAQPTQSRAK